MFLKNLNVALYSFLFFYVTIGKQWKEYGEIICATFKRTPKSPKLKTTREKCNVNVMRTPQKPMPTKDGKIISSLFFEQNRIFVTIFLPCFPIYSLLIGIAYPPPPPPRGQIFTLKNLRIFMKPFFEKWRKVNLECHNRPIINNYA